MSIKALGYLLTLLWTTAIWSANYSAELYQLYQSKSADYSPRTTHLKNGEPIYINELIRAHSPYLLQHAHNPVDWQEFAPETLAQAKKQNKLLFLSIGYATCHWCHVMEKESFEDIAVANILNTHYISLKVDREVQTDIDAHFMEVSRILTGTGGWPLNVLLTPDGDGFFAGTYIPNADLRAMLTHFQQLWEQDPETIIERSNFVRGVLEENAFISKTIPNNFDQEATSWHYELFDELDGGFGDAPKFPRENTLLFLINEELRTPNAERREMIITSLDMMSMGGMYDIVGGGFHRYSVDNNWLTPHFEKMLYNQARMSEVYARAYMLTGFERYKRVAERTLAYMLRELQSVQGGFYSGTDADSEGQEGAYFIWSNAELEGVFAKHPDARQYFEVSDSVLFDEHYILRYKDVETLSSLGITDYSVIDTLVSELQQLRTKREYPFLDNKVILSWNALVLNSLLVAGYSIDNRYYQEAKKLLDTLRTFITNQGLMRIRVAERIDTPALFVDYAYLISAYLNAYTHFANERYLTLAKSLSYSAIELFWDEGESLFNMSNNSQVYYQKKEVFDGALPSSNAVMYDALVRLSAMSGEAIFSEYAGDMLSSLSGMMVETPDNHTALLTYYLNHIKGDVSHVRHLYNAAVKVVKGASDITIELQPGWHVNAHMITQDGLIPTRITGEISDISYPAYHRLNVSFSPEPVLVYEGKVRISYTTENRFSPVTLQLQACSDTICLPPETITLY